MSAGDQKARVPGHLDTTQVGDVYKLYVDCLERRDVDGLVGLYHKGAVVIANRELARLTKSSSTNPEDFQTAYQKAGIGPERVWEYVQGSNDSFLVRSRVAIDGVDHDAFGYYALRDGKIWRQVSGIEVERTRSVSAQVNPERMHPMLTNLNEGLASGDPEQLMQYYTPNSVALFAANKSWAFRVRGVAEGPEEIYGFLSKYMSQGPEMVELKDYIEVDDTVYIHGLMSRNGVVSDSYGAWVLDDGLIHVGFSST